jgi:DNA-binding transcriptional LysR family regulator
MDIRLLKIFSAIARHGALGVASRDLHLTASALSHGLKALECELGTRLFDRVGGRLVLNQAGEQLLAQIQEPLAALEQAATAVKDLGRWGQGRLRVGAPASVCQHLLPEVLAELHRAFPKLFIHVDAVDSKRVLEQLDRHEIELAIALQPEFAPGLATTPLFEDELLFALPPEHPWATARSLSPQEIERQPLLLLTRGHFTRHLLDEFFAAQEIKPAALMEIGSLELLKHLVAQRVGVGVLPPWMLNGELDEGTIQLRPLGSKSLQRHWVLLHHAERILTWPEEKFLALLRGRLARLCATRKDLPSSTQKAAGAA